MKMLELEYNFENKVELSQFIHCIENIHLDVHWEIQQENNILLGYAKEDVWFYEYMLDFQSFTNIKVFVSKVDKLTPSIQCNLKFLEVIDNLENCEDNLEILELGFINDTIKDLYDSINMYTEVNLSLPIPILLKGHEEDLYEYEIHDLMIDLVRKRVDELKRLNCSIQELQILENILEHNSFKGEREAMISRLYETMMEKPEVYFKFLALSGINITKGHNYYFTFYDDPRYDYVSPINRTNEALYKDLLNKFF